MPTSKIKAFVFYLGLSASACLYAADMGETAFKSWMSGISVDGKKFFGLEKDGSALQATFVNPGNPAVGPRMISISPLKEFGDYQKGVDNPKMAMGPSKGFLYQGMRTVIVDTRSEIGMMAAVEAKNINKTFVMSFPSNTAQSAIEAGLLATGLYKK